MGELPKTASPIDLSRWVLAHPNEPFDPNMIVSATHTTDWQWQAVLAQMEDLKGQGYLTKLKQDPWGSTYWAITPKGENYLRALERAESANQQIRAEDSFRAPEISAPVPDAPSVQTTTIIPPVITKAVGAPALALKATTRLTFTITNPNPNAHLTDVSFTDVLPAGLVISKPNGLVGSWADGKLTAPPGGDRISLSGAALPPSASCSFQLSVTAVTQGTKKNVTGNVTSKQGGNGVAAAASLDVVRGRRLARPVALKGIMPIDWEKTPPRPPLDDFSKGLVREIAKQFLETGAGVPDHAKRVELGKNRHILNVLVQRNFITNIGNKFYPAFASLYYLSPKLRARCEQATAWVLKAFQALYRARGAVTLSLTEVSDEIDRMASEPIGPETARLGMLFTRDFPNYFAPNFEYSADAPIKAATVWDNILDFENLQQAWEEEIARRQPSTVSPASESLSKGAEKLNGTTKLETSTEKLRKVFVIHGRDERLRIGIFTFLRALGLEPLEWTKAMGFTGKASPYIGEILEAAFKHAQAAVVLLTPDDEARLREDLVQPDDPHHEKIPTGQARPNVLFEAGMAFASHPNQTVLVQLGQIRPFSDIAGRHIVKMDNSVQKRHELVVKLKTAGCSVDMEGADWQTVGDLTPPEEATSPAQPPGAQTLPGHPEPSAGQSKLSGHKRILVAPVSRSTSETEYTLHKVDEAGVVIRLSNGVLVRIPKGDYVESWDDATEKPKLLLTRKYFQGYFPGHENAEEYFLPR